MRHYVALWPSNVNLFCPFIVKTFATRSFTSSLLVLGLLTPLHVGLASRLYYLPENCLWLFMSVAYKQRDKAISLLRLLARGGGEGDKVVSGEICLLRQRGLKRHGDHSVRTFLTTSWQFFLFLNTIFVKLLDLQGPFFSLKWLIQYIHVHALSVIKL